MNSLVRHLCVPLSAIALIVTPSLLAQAPPLRSPEFAADGKVTFRIQAPAAQKVELISSDFRSGGIRNAEALTRDDSGVWSATFGPFDPGAYRYQFRVDGVSLTDPHNPAYSQSIDHVRSLLVVPGSEVMDTRDVPHGAISEVTYWSSSLNQFRRAHVYTPPGFESGKGTFPVLYLLHGSGDSDNSWSTVGRAGAILDNLIAAGKAKPMVVVMPNGHTALVRRPPGARGDEFDRDFVENIMPRMEKRFRIQSDRAHRAMAGLSMGGGQTLSVAIPHLDQFAHIGVFSSGLFGITDTANPENRGVQFEKANLAVLDDPALKTGLKTFWFGTGKDDRLITTTRATVDMFKRHGFTPTFKETEGDHAWVVWRGYLAEFLPQLF